MADEQNPSLVCWASSFINSVLPVPLGDLMNTNPFSGNALAEISLR